MAATEIIYIDANRQMSKKSDTLNNVWEYQLSDEALVLPAGSQITIQDTFVNKRGAGGQSIEIEEDIDEMIDFMVVRLFDLLNLDLKEINRWKA